MLTMKLLMVAIVLCSSVAAVPHLDAAQGGSSLIRNLRSEVGTMSLEEFKTYLPERLESFLKNNKKDAMSEEQFSTLMNSDVPIKNNRPLWRDINLLKRPAFVEWINTNIKEKDRPREVYQTLRGHNNRKQTVAIINAGKLADTEEVRALAYKMEDYMVKHWNRFHPVPLKQLFDELGLNETGDMDILFSYPAFSTWLSYVLVHHEEKYWRSKMFKVVKQSLDEGKTESINTYTDIARKLWEKIDYLREKRNELYTILKTKAEKKEGV